MSHILLCAKSAFLLSFSRLRKFTVTLGLIYKDLQGQDEPLPDHLSRPASADEKVFLHHDRRLDQRQQARVTVLAGTERRLVLLGERGLKVGHQDFILVFLQIKKE